MAASESVLDSEREALSCYGLVQAYYPGYVQITGSLSIVDPWGIVKSTHYIAPTSGFSLEFFTSYSVSSGDSGGLWVCRLVGQVVFDYVSTIEYNSESSPEYVPYIEPDGELTASAGWCDSYGRATLHCWRQTLTPEYESFSGRMVTEYDPGGGGPDTCREAFPESIIEPAVAITGGSWRVGVDNKWGLDFVGWTPFAVSYYRNAGVAPCETQFPQVMKIDHPGGYESDYPYAFNLLRMGFTNTTVWSERAGQYAERIWP